MSTLFHNILRAAASAMEIPVVICLLLLAFSVFSLGWDISRRTSRPRLLPRRRIRPDCLPKIRQRSRTGPDK